MLLFFLFLGLVTVVQSQQTYDIGTETVTVVKPYYPSVSDAFKISIDDLKSHSRRREISLARQVGMYLMRQHTDLSLPKIGDQFGGKDHTTVMYSCDKITQLIKRDLNLAQTVREVSDRITLSSNS